MKRKSVVRLYRGLSKKYRSEQVGRTREGIPTGTDFSDCPYLALKFGRGTRGWVVVLDVPSECFAGSENCTRFRVTEELYSYDGKGPKRFMVWGKFDDLLVAEIPAKELRAQVRRRGIGTLPHKDKSQILADYVEQWIQESARVPRDLDRAVRGNRCDDREVG